MDTSHARELFFVVSCRADKENVRRRFRASLRQFEDLQESNIENI